MGGSDDGSQIDVAAFGRPGRTGHAGIRADNRAIVDRHRQERGETLEQVATRIPSVKTGSVEVRPIMTFG